MYLFLVTVLVFTDSIFTIAVITVTFDEDVQVFLSLDFSFRHADRIISLLVSPNWLNVIVQSDWNAYFVYMMA